ncbi:DUF4440 domain-containing protein [Corallococcus exercitus]|uniref:DUF4440 domain-containing protein n=1 Tax=Corallococcus exercitus TaxID=2316736 RepID=A0A7Y4KN98_9BACT|nr:DUF4440 domain-containing protein [Corallococcus exercitus]NOK36871.1 DUF4440 domain-containing protein [Corallococcus exercitus]
MNRMFAGAPGVGDGAVGQPAALSAADARARLRQADQAMSDASAKAGSAKGFADFLAEDAVLLVEGEYALKGRQAIQTWLTAHPLEQGGTLRWEPVRWDVSADGTLGYSVGTATVDAEGATQQAVGRYISAWRLQADGQWRVAATVRNAATTPMTPPEGFSPANTEPGAAARTLSKDAVLEEAMAADRAFSAQSVREGMGKAFTAWAAQDAVLLTGDAGLYGQDSIARVFAPFTLEQNGLSWEPVLGDAAASGDLAYTVGRAIATGKDAQGQPRKDFVKYLTVWRRQADGPWRYVTDGGNSSPGPQGP